MDARSEMREFLTSRRARLQAADVVLEGRSIATPSSARGLAARRSGKA
jgi:hypothetical protein